MYKLELSKHFFSPPVAANEKDTEAADSLVHWTAAVIDFNQKTFHSPSSSH